MSQNYINQKTDFTKFSRFWQIVCNNLSGKENNKFKKITIGGVIC